MPLRAHRRWSTFGPAASSAFWPPTIIAAAKLRPDADSGIPGGIGAIGDDAGDCLIGRGPTRQFRQHGRVTDVADGELDGLHFQGPADADMDLAPVEPGGAGPRDDGGALSAAMSAGVSLPLALDLDLGAVGRQMRDSLWPAVENVDLPRIP